jgi:hypothetical protein
MVNMSGKIFALCISILLAASAAQAQQAVNTPGNMLVNGDFTAGLKGWTPHANKDTGTAMMDNAVLHTNRPTLRIDNVKPDDTIVGQRVDVNPNTRYRMTAFIRTKDVLAEKRGNKDGATMSVSGGFIKTPPIFGSKGWTRVTLDFTTGQETSIEIGARLGHYSALVTGTAWFADMSLVELGKAPNGKFAK